MVYQILKRYPRPRGCFSLWPTVWGWRRSFERTPEKKNGWQIIWALDQKMRYSHTAVINQQKFFEFTQELVVWVPHEFSNSNKKWRLDIVSQHLVRYRASHNHKTDFCIDLSPVMRTTHVRQHETKIGTGGYRREDKSQSPIGFSSIILLLVRVLLLTNQTVDWYVYSCHYYYYLTKSFRPLDQGAISGKRFDKWRQLILH